jgi:hypothetical protein
MFLLHYAQIGFGAHPSSYMMARAFIVKVEVVEDSEIYHGN